MEPEVTKIHQLKTQQKTAEKFRLGQPPLFKERLHNCTWTAY